MQFLLLLDWDELIIHQKIYSILIFVFALDDLSSTGTTVISTVWNIKHIK